MPQSIRDLPARFQDGPTRRCPGAARDPATSPLGISWCLSRMAQAKTPRGKRTGCRQPAWDEERDLEDCQAAAAWKPDEPRRHTSPVRMVHSDETQISHHQIHAWTLLAPFFRCGIEE